MESRVNLNRKDPIFLVLDMEMTGLDPDKDKILEVACCITKKDLKIIDTYSAVIGASQNELSQMSEWCKNVHGATGLTKECLETENTIELVQSDLLKMVKKYAKLNEAMLVGCSPFTDRLFLRKQMPQFEAYLHYRMIDASSLGTLREAWTGVAFSFPKVGTEHRALDDVKKCILLLNAARLSFRKPWPFLKNIQFEPATLDKK